VIQTPNRQAKRSKLAETVETVTGQRAVATLPLAGGCIAEVLRIDLEGGGALVAKVADPAAGGLAVEARMLGYLAEHSALPVPRVLHGDDGLLLMDFVESSGGPNARAQGHAAELLAAPHGLMAPAFGFDWDRSSGRSPSPTSGPRTGASFSATSACSPWAGSRSTPGGFRRRASRTWSVSAASWTVTSTLGPARR